MKEFTTQDGSITLHNEKYDEYYHSKSGAIEEAFEKYIKPCRISELAKKGSLRILDIGFGLGYNAIATIDKAIESNPACEIEVISLEKDDNIIKEIQKLNPCLKNYFIVKKLEYDPLTKSYLFEDKNIFFRIKMGDARDTIKSSEEKFDAVFLAPFSPAKNPELWTEDFLKEVCKRMKIEAILATFSYARQVRENLKKAGFFVFDGPVVGRRSPYTLAKIKS
jgi:tRNA U34 5-methylaminomethyl-2-thiouridine-forming methyltransferase MnmC